MQLTITPTNEIYTVEGGLLVRRWQGRTPLGRHCDVYVAVIGSGDPGAQAELEAALLEVPGALVRRDGPPPSPAGEGGYA